MPAMPTTRWRGNPETSSATWHIASSGLVTAMMIASGERSRDLLGDALDDLAVRGEQVVAAHAGLARQARGDHDDVGARGLVVGVRADDVRLVADHRPGLVQVERLALRQALDDVHQHDVGVVTLGQPLRGRRADVARSDDCDLPSHRCTPSLIHFHGTTLQFERVTVVAFTNSYELRGETWHPALIS